MFLLPRKITEPLRFGLFLLIFCIQLTLGAAPSGKLNHQGRIAVDGIYFDSTTAGHLGLFKFALVSANGEELYWSNDGSLEAPGEPTNAVELKVTKGLYSLMLGDSTLTNMSALPDDLFVGNRAVWLRVWFDDGIHGFQQISPDQQFAPAPFAFIAEKANTSVSADSAKNFTNDLSGDVTGTQSSTLIAPSVITGKNLEGYEPLSGGVSHNDTILSALGKLDGNSELKAPLASPTFTGTVSGITKSMVGLGNVDNTADLDKPISTAQQAAFIQQEDRTAHLEFLQFIQANELDVRTGALEVNKAPLASPTFTGTVSGITKSMVGLGSVDNTADADKPISDLTQAALNLKADAAAMEIALAGKQAAGSYATLVDGTVPANQLPSYVDDVVEFAELGEFPEAGEVGKIYVATTTGKIYRWSGSVYIGIDPSPGSSDAVAEGPGNLYFTAERASAAAPVQSVAGKSGVVTLSKVDVGLGNVDNTADVDKPVSTAQQEALDLKASLSALNLKAPLASPTFTGTVSGITKSMVGLGNVDNTADLDKPISTAQQAAFIQQEDRTAHLEFLQFIQANELDVRTGALEVNKAPLASPTFTGTVSGITKSMVGLGSVDNTADADKPISDLTQAALNLKADAAAMEIALAGKQAAGSYATLVDGTVPANQLPSYVDDVVEFAELGEFPEAGEVGKIYVATTTGKIYRWSGSVYIGIDPSPGSSDAVAEGSGNLYFTAERASAAAPVQSVAGKSGVVTLSKVDVGLGNVDNTADVDKPVSTAQQEALDLKASLSALNLKAPLVSPTFTGTVSGITKSMVGLGNVDNTADLDKPVSTAQQEALDLKADVTALNGVQADARGVESLADFALHRAEEANAGLAGKQAAGSYATLVDGTVPANQLPSYVDDVVEFAELGEFPEAGEVGKIYVATTTGKIYRWSGSVYIGIDPSPGSSDAVAEGSGNLYFTAERASAAAPVQSVAGKSGVVTLSKVDVGLGNVDNTADANKPVSTAQQAALNLKADVTELNGVQEDASHANLVADLALHQADQANAGLALKADQSALNLKAPLASPTFTGTVSGITKSMVGLGDVDNTADADKPISDLTQAALNLKADAAVMETALAGKQVVGDYVTLVDGMVPVDQLPLTLDKITAAPVLPVIAWGGNDLGQTTVPSLVNVAGIAARESHSLVLLNDGTVVTWGNGPAVPANLDSVVAIAAGSSHDLAIKSDGSVVAWGNNTYGQTSVPSGITTAIHAAAGEKHSLILLSTGAVTAWGNNSFGQSTVPVAASTNVTAIAAGYDHSLALKEDGTVVAWGRSDANQISVPVGLSNVVAIAAGAYHSLAVKGDGTVVAWGYNNGGQSTIPAGLTGVANVTAGYAFSAALKNDGTLVTWGDNTYGQVTIPTTATQVTHLAAGANHMMALRADLIPVQVARLDQDNVFTGNVGIKRTPATNSLEVEGNASKTTASNWLANSDRRIKTEITSLTGALKKIDQVRLVDFRYTDDYLAAHPAIEDIRYLNVIAQEFAEVFPDHVKESGEFLADGSPILQVDTYPLTIYSAAALQELHRDTLELRSENAALKKKLNDQEDRLSKLEVLLKNR